MRLARGILMAFWLGRFLVSGEAQSGGTPWVFEGRLDHVDVALAPQLKSGWVLSGSFGHDPSRMRPDADSAAGGRIRFAGGIEGAEVTVDLYYQVKAAAFQGDGLAGYDWLPAEEETLSQISYFLPLEGRVEGTPWTFRWLQLMLQGSWREAPPALPAAGLDWESGYFRLIFTNADGATVEAWGSLTLFGPEGEAELKESARWEAALADLGRTLAERDATIASLEEALGQARSKVGALQGMLDLMAQQRLELEAENQRLEGLLRAFPEEERARRAGELAERALLAEALAAAESRSTVLEEKVEAMTAHAASLRLQLDALTQTVSVAGVQAGAEIREVAPMRTRAFEEAIPDRADEEVASGKASVEPSPSASESARSPRPVRESGDSERPERRFGPSKFR